MDGGVRETICTSCIHRKVCKNAELYLEFLKEYEKLYGEFQKDIGFIEPKDPVCRFYSKKSDVTMR